DFHRISPKFISGRLQYVASQENASITEDASMLIAAIADGAMRDALSIMDRCLGVTSNITVDTVRAAAGLAQKDYLFELAAACINKNTEKALSFINQLYNDSKDMARLCDELLDHFRTLMLIKSTRNPQQFVVMSAEEFEEAQTQADYLTLAEIVYIMDILQTAYQRMGKGNSDRVELEMALVKLSAPELEGTNEALISRVAALEKMVNTGKITTVAEVQQQTITQPVESEKPKAPVKEPLSSTVTETVKEEMPAEVETPPLPTEPQTTKAKEAPVQTQTEVSSPSLEEIYQNAQPFRQWPEVVENIKHYSKAIASAFSDTEAYVSGNLLLINADSEIPFKLLRESAQRDKVRTAIQEVTGKIYKLGPYKKPEKQQKQTDPFEELISNLKENNVNITEE
ncbi:MAG: DNA polymerase III subunit gamma/tau, partial [Ruminococcus sp.]